jgi:hypothetical protein
MAVPARNSYSLNPLFHIIIDTLKYPFVHSGSYNYYLFNTLKGQG